MSIQRLLAAAQQLDEAEVELLCEMADAFGWDVDAWLNPGSDLVLDGFGDSLLNRLRLHHATSEEKFNKTSFEFAFKAASRFAGRHAEKTLVHTFQGADVLVDGVRWSLKTEGAANMSPTVITISKFSEARWIRDCVTQEDFADELTVRIGRHLREYDRVLTLRGFYVRNNEAVKYELIQIPHAMLVAATRNGDRLLAADQGQVRAVPESCTSGSTPSLSSSTAAWKKVTLRNIQVAQCVTHARWTVPVLPLDD